MFGRGTGSKCSWILLSLTLVLVAFYPENVLPTAGAGQVSPFAGITLEGQTPTALPILPGNTWTYLKGTAAPPSNWNSPAFDDAGWSSGTTPIGYGDGTPGTVLSDMQGSSMPPGYVSVYTRKAFDVPDPGAIGGLTLTIDYDDGFIAYLNGSEVARRNVSGNPPSYNATATASHESSFGTNGNPPETISLDAYVGLLVAGQNVLAIEGHNVAVTSTDFMLNVTLQATNPPPVAPAAPDSPANGATGTSPAPDLCVSVHDPNADPMNVTFRGREATPSGENFTVVVIPDPQYYSSSYPATYNAQMQWIVDNRVARNIVFVTDVGDSTNDNNTAQWGNVSSAFSLLENPVTTGLPDGIPFGITLGNHDQTPNGSARTGSDEGATSVLYNQNFGQQRFCPSGVCRSYFGENYTFGGALPDNMDNHYELFNADGMEFIAFHLEWDQADNPTRQAVLAWMRNILLNVYPSRRALITSHYLINPSDASWSNQGQAIYDAVKDVPNVFAMFSGHLDQANLRTDTYNGHTIHTMVADYQSRPNGGNGWMRILTFSPRDNSIHVQTYSPTLDQLINNHADNTAGTAKNDFTLPYVMGGSSPFATLGTVPGVADGAQACLQWPGRQGGKQYEWYVDVSDGTSTTTSAWWTFTASCAGDADCNDDNACTVDSCGAGVCSHTSIPGCGCNVNADCDNGNLCDGVETCSGGTCMMGAPLVCNDANLCTTDTCVPATGCVYTNNTLPCNDGNACTIGDTCSGGACDGTYQPVTNCCTGNADCNDGNPATVDKCTAGNCSNTASTACGTDADCNDADACTTDTCSVSTNTDNTWALSFNGSNQYVTMGTASGLGTARFTLECWFSRTGAGATTTTGTGGLASAIPLVTKGRGEGESPANLNMNYFLGIDSATNTLAADFEDTAGGGNHPVRGTTALPAGSGWHHAAATYDGTTWRIYLDGNLETTLAANATPEATSIQHFGIATAMTSTGGTAGFFAGRIDEVRVWSRALSQSEIQANKNRQVTAGTGLLGRWGLNDGSGNTAANSVAPPANDGTLTNSPGWINGSGNVPDLGPWYCGYSTTNCSDNNPCTLDVCDGGVCSHPLGDDGAACDDGNGCTTGDTCISGICQGGTAVPGCCANDAECSDSQSCTADRCVKANAAALSFNGSNQYVTMGAASALGATQFTLETWFYRTGSGQSNTTGSGGFNFLVPLVAKGAPEADGSNLDANYIFGINTGTCSGGAGNCTSKPYGPNCSCVVNADCNSGSCISGASAVLGADFEDTATGLNHPVSGVTPILTNTWYHAVAAYDGTTWRLYLNGNLEATLAVGAFTPRSDSVQPFGLATMQRSAQTPLQVGFFAGRMDEVRIWNRALPQADIQANMNQQVLSGCGLLGRWGLDEATGTLAVNSVGLPSTNGTLVSGPSWNTTDLQNFGSNHCAFAPMCDGASCSDSNACTQTDACLAGVCSGSNPVTCTPSDQCHVAGTCNPSTGLCSNPNAPDGTTCNDSDACTQTDACLSGACSGSNPVVCAASDQCHVAGMCNPSTGQCSNPNAPDGTSCSDGQFCTLGDSCASGICSGALNPCSDGIACTLDSCDEATDQCVSTDNCQPGWTCSHATGLCEPPGCTGPQDCSDGNACTEDVCDTGTGQCSHPPVTDGTACDDGILCTAPDACEGGICAGAPVPNCCVADSQCADASVCTMDFCPIATGGPAALSFNGTSSRVVMGPAPGLGSTAFTLECWFSWRNGGSTASSGSGGVVAYPLVTKGRGEGDNSNLDMNYFLGVGADGKLKADYEEGAGQTSPGLNHPASGTTALTQNDGQWHHAAATFDGTTWKLYLDGWLDGTTVIGTGRLPRFDSLQHFGVGTALNSLGETKDSSGNVNGFFSGLIDEVRVWNRALSAEEIEAGRGRELDSGSGLVGRWGFNEGGGTLAYDSAAPPENGTIENAAWQAGVVDFGVPNQCVHAAVPNCCVTDADCDDGNACTTDACVLNQCQRSAIPGCCTTDAQCGDGNACTADVCSGNVCTNPAIDNCCTSDAACSDGNACTADTCDAATTAALAFNGTSSYVTMGEAPGLGAAQFTVETWFKRTGTGVGNTTGNLGIASLVPLVAKGAPEADGSNVDANYVLGIDTAGDVLAADFEDTATGLNHPVSGATAISNDVWYHAAATYDGTTWRLYLNGNLDRTLAVGSYTPRYDSIQPFGLGTMQKSSLSPGRLGFFAGALDEVRVWNRALSEAEIRANMNRQLASGAGLIGRWGLEEGTGNTAAESVAPPANNGTLQNATWVTDADQLPLAGTNRCEFPPAPNGTACSDGSECTLSDACQDGACAAGQAPDCDDGNPCTVDSCDPGTPGGCVHTPVGAGTVCRPAVGPCDAAEVCDGTGAACAADGSVPNGTACNDGNACTRSDTCQAGACIGGASVICTASDQCHEVGTCDPATGTCSNPPKGDATPCTDGNVCTSGDACVAGICVSGPPPAGTDLHVDQATGFDAGNDCRNPALPCLTIQHAIDSSCAAGEVVHVAAGTYLENVVVNRTVTLLGAGMGVTIVQPAISAANPCTGSSLCGGAASNVFLVQASNVTLRDLTVDGDNPALTGGIVRNGVDLDARNGIITDHTLGVFNALEVDHVEVKNIYLRGMYASSGGTFNFHDNVVSNVAGDAYSIAMFNFGGSGVMARNTVTLANDAISSNWSTGVQFLSNVVTASSSGIHTDNAGGSGGTADLIQGNQVLDCAPDGYGIWVYVPYLAPTFAQNTIRNCAVAMSAWGGAAPVTTVFSENRVDGQDLANSTGFYVTTDQLGYGTGDVSVSFTGNLITRTAEAGLVQQPGSAASVSLSCNRIEGNGKGITSEVSGVTAHGNAFSGNGTALDGTAIPSGTLDATGNWWGCASGPGNPGCDSVTGSVDASTALSAPPGCVTCAGSADGSACSDDNACTRSDTCQAGACVGSNPVVCANGDPCNDSGACIPATGLCSPPVPKTNGTECNDSNACTRSDACEAGVCTGRNPVVCTPLDQCHEAGACEMATGLCSNPPKPNGTACEDGDACTVEDSCQTGNCLAGFRRDDDLDSHGNAACGGDDCDDSNPLVWHPPAEVENLTLTTSSPADPSWDSQEAMAGPGTVHDLTSGDFSAAPGINFAAASCLQAGGGSQFIDIRSDPALESGFWYLARARNSCGIGTYGSAARDTAIPACP